MATRSKPMFHKVKTCKAEYDVMFTDSNIPYLKCSGCGHENKDWIKWEDEYSKYHTDETKWTVRDLPMAMLGLFCDLYFKVYNQKFILSLNERGLFNGVEYNIIRKLIGNLSNDPSVCKEYMLWFFDKKVSQRKKPFNSLAILAAPEVLNDFKTHQKMQTIITRDRLVPGKMLEWIKGNAPTVLDLVSLHDYGDMHLLLSAYAKGQFQIPDMKIMIDKFQRIGLVDEKLKLRNWQD